MRELGLKCQSRLKRKQPVKVKKATSAGYIYENLLKRDFSTTRLNEKWVADMTEIAVDDEKLFVSAIMDVHKVIRFHKHTMFNSSKILYYML
jgi:putative transposase